jgi:hypothetical protein
MYPQNPQRPTQTAEQPPNYQPTPSPNIPGTAATSIGAALTLIGFFFMPWINLGLFGSLTGWDTLNTSSRFASLNQSASLFTLSMWAIMLAGFLILGTGIAGLMNRGSAQLNLAAIIAGFIGLILMAIGLYQFFSATVSQAGQEFQINYFSYIGFGVYATALGFIIALVGSFSSRKEHWT